MKRLLGIPIAILYYVSNGVHFGQNVKRSLVAVSVLYFLGFLSVNALIRDTYEQLFGTAEPTEDHLVQPDQAKKTSNFSILEDKNKNGPLTLRPNAKSQEKMGSQLSKSQPQTSKLSPLPDYRARDVKLIQAALYERGCYDGAIDGIWGTRTTDAIRNFNRKNKTALRETGPRIEDLKLIQSPMSFACISQEAKCFKFNGRLICQ
tara:strand:+ start:10432 stop:11046 length:615 start_codon:yes stop_codon:yes gene_type:complete